MAESRIQTPQGRGGQSRYKQYRSDTRGIQALLTKQLEGEKEKGISRAEHIILQKEAEDLAKQYYDRGQKPEFYGDKDDPRGTFSSYYLTEAYDVLKKEGEAVGEAERFDIESRAKRQGAADVGKRDAYGYNSDTFKGTGNLRTDLYEKARINEYQRLVLVGKEVEIQTEMNRISTEIGKNTDEGMAAGIDLYQKLQANIAKEQDGYIRSQMELMLANESVTLPAIFRANEKAIEDLAIQGAVTDLTMSATNGARSVTADSTIEFAMLRIAQVNNLDADIRAASNNRMTAAPGTVDSLLQIIIPKVDGIIQNTAIQHGDSFGSFATTSPEAAENMYFLFRDLGKGGKIPSGEYAAFGNFMTAGNITDEGQRKTQADNYRIERTVAGGTQFFVRQQNLFRAWRDAAGNDPEAIRLVENKIKAYTANFWDDADRGLREAGWINTEKRRELIERLEVEWKRVAEWSDKDLNRRAKQQEENINKYLAAEHQRQELVMGEVAHAKENGTLIPESVFQSMASFGHTSKPGSLTDEKENLARVQAQKDGFAYNDVLRVFAQTGRIDDVFGILQDYAVSSSNVYGDPRIGDIPSHYGTNAYNLFYDRQRVYNDASLLKAVREWKGKWELMSEDDKTNWRLRFGGGRDIDVGEIPSSTTDAEGKNKPMDDTQKAQWLVSQIKEQYNVAAQNLGDSDAGIALMGSRGDNKIPLTEEQSNFLSKVAEARLEEGDSAAAENLLRSIQGDVYIRGVPENALEKVLAAIEIRPHTPFIRESLYTPIITGNGAFAQLFQKLEIDLGRTGLINSDEVRQRDAATVNWAISAPYIQRMILAAGDGEKEADVIEDYRKAIKDIILEDGTVKMPTRTVNPNFTIKGSYESPRNVNIRHGTTDGTEFNIDFTNLSATDMVRAMQRYGEYKELYISVDDDPNAIPFDPANKEHTDALTEMLGIRGLITNIVNRGKDRAGNQFDVYEFIIENESGFGGYKFNMKGGKELRFLFRVPMVNRRRPDVF